MATKKRPQKRRRAKLVTGSCCCGAVAFTVKGALRDVVNCHCSKCRRWHGHVGAYTMVPRGEVEFSERKGLRWWDASVHVQRGFCGLCGSSLFWSDSNDASLGIAAGVLDEPTGIRTTAHIFVGSKGDYYGIDDGLPQFEGYE